jgi:hypothetical protein
VPVVGKGLVKDWPRTVKGCVYGAYIPPISCLYALLPLSTA